MTPSQHDRHNSINYPGTRQLCVICDSQTDRCEEDSLYVGDDGPLCMCCHDDLTVKSVMEVS